MTPRDQIAADLLRNADFPEWTAPGLAQYLLDRLAAAGFTVVPVDEINELQTALASGAGEKPLAVLKAADTLVAAWAFDGEAEPELEHQLREAVAAWKGEE